MSIFQFLRMTAMGWRSDALLYIHSSWLWLTLSIFLTWRGVDDDGGNDLGMGGSGVIEVYWYQRTSS